MTRFRILPYRQGSAGARKLAEGLGGRVLRLSGSTFASTTSDVLINWGNTNPVGAVTPGVWGQILNLPATVRRASNKREFFQLLAAADLSSIAPPFWTDAASIPDDAFPIVCRTVLAGHSGEGIVIANNRDELVPAPLYVKYVKKSQEFRVHVGDNSFASKVITIQRKARKADVPDGEVNWKVRNLAGGFIYAREGVEQITPPLVLNTACQALRAVDLQFGAVDVIWNEQQQRAYVLEINTAPGLEGQTIADYANYFKGLVA